MLKYCHQNNASLTFVSSYIYGQPDHLPISESTHPKPNNPYAHGKYLTEQLCEFYSKEFGIKTVILRPFNIYGPGQKDSFLIPSLIRQVQNDDQIHLQDLEPKRDFVHINDVIDALVLSIKPPEQFSIFNIASGRSVSVKELINMIQKLQGTCKEIASEKSRRKNEILDTQADIGKAKTQLNWFPKISIEEGLKGMIQQ